MSDHTYKIVEIVGSSPSSIEEAIGNGVARASQTLRNMRWFEVVQIRGEFEKGEIAFYQAHLKIGFTLDAASST